jgi:hypothetical protein
VNQDIEEAKPVWSDYGAFHAAFGPLQRLRNDVFCETLSPMPGPGAGSDVPPQQQPQQARELFQCPDHALPTPCMFLPV